MVKNAKVMNTQHKIIRPAKVLFSKKIRRSGTSTIKAITAMHASKKSRSTDTRVFRSDSATCGDGLRNVSCGVKKKEGCESESMKKETI